MYFARVCVCAPRIRYDYYCVSYKLRAPGPGNVLLAATARQGGRSARAKLTNVYQYISTHIEFIQ